MSACEAFEVDLVDASTGELSADRKAALARHLEGCGACRDELAALAETASLLERTAARQEDLQIAGFAARAADRAERFRDRSWRGAWWSLLRPTRLALLGAAGALAAAIVLVVARPVAPPAAPEIARAAEVAPAPTSTDTLALADDDGADPWLDSAFDTLDDDTLDALDESIDFITYDDPS